MKNLISTLFLGGALAFNSYAQTTELEKYDKENKQLHEDFMKFCNENPKKERYSKEIHAIKFPNRDYSISFDEDESFLNVHADTNFLDVKGDGLDNKSSDSYSFTNKKTNLMKLEYIEDLSPEEQLSIAKQYTALKKQIMHDEKYKNY